MSEPLKAIARILWKGILPPALAMVLMILGLLIGSMLAWIPIGLTISVLAVLFVHRIRQKEVQDELLMLKPFIVRPIDQLVEEYKRLLKRKRKL